MSLPWILEFRSYRACIVTVSRGEKWKLSRYTISLRASSWSNDQAPWGTFEDNSLKVIKDPPLLSREWYSRYISSVLDKAVKCRAKAPFATGVALAVTFSRGTATGEKNRTGRTPYLFITLASFCMEDKSQDQSPRTRERKNKRALFLTVAAAPLPALVGCASEKFFSA